MFYEIERAAIMVEEPVQVCFFMPRSLLTTAMYANYAEKSLDTTAFVARWMVAIEVENNVGVSFLTINGCFKVTRR